MKYIKGILIVTGIILTFGMEQLTAQQKKLTFEDVMKFEDIGSTGISSNGEWISYSVRPDRGDGEVRIRSTDGRHFFTIERGDDPELTKNGEWVGAVVKPPLKQQLSSEKEKPKQGAAFLNTSNGNVIRYDSVSSFEFSTDGEWVTARLYRSKTGEKKASKNKYLGTTLILKNLESEAEITIPFVSDAEFDSTSSYLSYSITDTTGTNGLYFRALNDPTAEHEIMSSKNGYYSNLSWDNSNRRLAFTAAQLDSTFKLGEAAIYLWDEDSGTRQLLDSSDANKGWTLQSNNKLEWTHGGNRLFFAFIPEEMADLESNAEEKSDSTEEIDIYDTQMILEKKGLDVWHWNDPRIKPHEKETWGERKNHLYIAVYHFDTNNWVQLADREMPDVEFTHNSRYALGSSSIPYLKEMTWNFFFDDYFVVDLKTGERRKIAKKLSFDAELSPGGRFVVFYEDRNWKLYDIENDIYRNLTEDLDVPFYNEDHDYPYPVPGYDIGGWVENDSGVLIYDKYDIWQFHTDGNDPIRITDGTGRENKMIFRIEDLDREKEYFDRNGELLLQSYHDKNKNYGFYTARIGREGATRRLEEEKKFQFVAKAKNDDRILYTRESYREYPNLWISNGMNFRRVKRLSELHLDITEKYFWGKAELVEWNNLDGTPMQGVLIKPGNYEEGKRYPVLIYFYRFYSQRLYDFNVPRNNHRPVFAQYTSDGYAVFLPDIRFEVGTPGFAATKSLVPGVQELVDMGIADPDGLGLHGHSWSGYQTAFIITQTDIFDAAVAGAPVSNMTSAYSGIRWGSGLARQFQYEQTQSRIGGSLWEYPERYIENSPVFFADRITTPLLIQFGDDDGAVPWYQGIELYLAMRRLGKEAVFLQYHGEPHHLQQYPNKLDYAIKMKQYFDHYLKGTPAAKWITEGVPYKGE